MSFMMSPDDVLTVGADDRRIDELWAQVRRCRRLGAGAGDRRTTDALDLMAAEYEAKARELERNRAGART
jgi:hypothetical protein